MIKVIRLNGSKPVMGSQYGEALREELKEIYLILADFFYGQLKLPKEKIDALAQSFFSKFPIENQKFIEGISTGSGLSLDAIKIINAMEVIFGQVVDRSKPQGCSFVAIKDELGNNSLIGRNYDYAPPFDQISKFLTVTILNETDLVPTGSIALAGQAYCPTCFNKNSLLLALNNGMPSGGFMVRDVKKTILISLLEAMQNSKDIAQLENYLKKIDSDYSLIINVADSKSIRSFEYSSSSRLEIYSPKLEENFASTNYYLNEDWNLPEPQDNTTWQGVSRRNNLLSLEPYGNQLDKLKEKLEKKVEDQGAAIKNTIYQVIYDYKDQKLHIKITNHGNWCSWGFKELFGL